MTTAAMATGLGRPGATRSRVTDTCPTPIVQPTCRSSCHQGQGGTTVQTLGIGGCRTGVGTGDPRSPRPETPDRRSRPATVEREATDGHEDRPSRRSFAARARRSTGLRPSRDHTHGRHLRVGPRGIRDDRVALGRRRSGAESQRRAASAAWARADVVDTRTTPVMSGSDDRVRPSSQPSRGRPPWRSTIRQRLPTRRQTTGRAHPPSGGHHREITGGRVACR